MHDAITKAASLVEANRYIQEFRGRIVVVKVGGSVQEDDEKLKALLTDVSFMSAVGIRPIIVHGGGKKISAAMQSAGLVPRFIQGRRYTDARTLEIAEHILVEEINAGLVDHLNESGCKAIGLHSRGSCVLFAERLLLPDPATGELLDLGLVGRVNEVNTTLLSALCAEGIVPVIAPVALSRDERDRSWAATPGDARASSEHAGWKLNVNADTAAARVAKAIGAAKLVMCSDTPGIRTDNDDENSYASTLTRSQIADLVDRGVIGEGMLPKVEACLIALEGGVPKAHVIDGRVPHSILLEIYTDAGVGTQIVLEDGSANGAGVSCDGSVLKAVGESRPSAGHELVQRARAAVGTTSGVATPARG